MPHFIYIIRPTRPEMLTTGPTPEEAGAVSAHFHYLRDLVDQGTGFMAGRTLVGNGGTMGLFIYEANDLKHAENILDHDPAVAAGVFAGTIQPFGISLWGDKKPI